MEGSIFGKLSFEMNDPVNRSANDSLLAIDRPSKILVLHQDHRISALLRGGLTSVLQRG
jgi:hypothetical protein